MQLAQFTSGNGPRVGLVQGESLVDLTSRFDVTDMLELMARWDALQATLQAIREHEQDFALAKVRLLAPVTRPGKIFAIGLNYADHCQEARLAVPEHQTWFTKAGSSINGPFDSIERPAVSEQLDYEAELVAIIGHRCRNVPKARAQEVVFGYCVGNDVSVRDWQLLTTQWCLGKSFDHAAPIGPWITTADAVNPHSLGIRSFVNGQKRQSSNTRHLVFNVFDMVAYLSQAMTLEPGDVIFTGTPMGVGLHFPGGPVFLKPGDVVRVEIDRLGAIENRVEAGSGEPMIS
ncbi:MAG TPA: fumarylacetoacetate hydrolase family protein [Steroidobacteraceae bacterium]|nr:fumarylacetoacetate hydrolase family protein [Steroidobacteraceae bacterium]